MSQPPIREWGFWTRHKLDILGEYLTAFLMASQRAGERIYLDGFAGEGRGAEKFSREAFDGSPVLALQACPEHPFTRLKLFEQQPTADRLERLLQTRFAGRPFEVLKGDFNENLDAALESLRSSDLHFYPTFAFLDPDGISELAWSSVRKLADHKRDVFQAGRAKGKVELFLLFYSSGVIREVARDEEGNVPVLNRLFGDDSWRPIARRSRDGSLTALEAREEYVNLQRWKLETELGYSWTYALPFVNEKKAVLYHMIFATDHLVGSDIMKRIYGRALHVGEDLRRRARDMKTGQLDFPLGEAGAPTAPPGFEYEPPTQPRE